MKNDRLAFYDCEIAISSGGHVKVNVYHKLAHTGQYLRFDSHHLLKHKLGVITVLKDIVAGEAELHHIKKGLSKCRYPRVTFVKAGKTPKEFSW